MRGWCREEREREREEERRSEKFQDQSDVNIPNWGEPE